MPAPPARGPAVFHPRLEFCRVHRFLSVLLHLFLALMLGAATPLAAQAAEFVSIKGNAVNVRAQPSTRAPVQWELDQGYPLRVQQKKGRWLKVADFEATLGWVYAPLTEHTPHRIVTASRARLRAGPGTGQRILATLAGNEIVRTLTTRGGWVQVQRSNGQRGWVAKRLTWGW